MEVVPEEYIAHQTEHNFSKETVVQDNNMKNWVSTGLNKLHIILMHDMNQRYIGNKGWGARDRPGGGMGVQAHCRASFTPCPRLALTTINGHLAPVKASTSQVETSIVTEGHFEEKHKGV